MSWQAYVDSSLVGTGHIDKAAIFSAAGDSTWASTPGFTVGAPELATVVGILAEAEASSKPKTDKAYGEGIHIAGERYVATRIEGNHIYGRHGKTGIAIVKTKQAILVGHYGENTQAGNATTTVEALADYLTGLGY
ncbi:profilin [Podospora fimiseda]|uniref:Profilin n=1 Tax=Podospora fimiseda TaxID=252190 RepID=A0AAN7BX95_9PEZI|nr:profilin [Podospora fimiseda]